MHRGTYRIILRASYSAAFYAYVTKHALQDSGSKFGFWDGSNAQRAQGESDDASREKAVLDSSSPHAPHLGPTMSKPINNETARSERTPEGTIFWRNDARRDGCFKMISSRPSQCCIAMRHRKQRTNGGLNGLQPPCFDLQARLLL